ncbi:hypothetical protein CHUAL_004013 [Chamberlinius hualienensis]
MIFKYQLKAATIITIHISLAWIVPCYGELQCYHCGIKNDGSDICETHPSRASSEYIVRCPPDSYCSKTLSRQNNGELKLEATRGCASQVTLNGKRHGLGCSTDQRTGAYVCYCNTYLCNKGHHMQSQLKTLLLTLLPIILINYVRTKF